MKLRGGGAFKTYELGAVEITAKDEVDANPSVNVIKAKDIKDSNSDNVAQALRMTPGVFFQEGTGNRNEATIRIRGFDSAQVGYYLDGIPMMEIYDRRSVLGEYTTQGISSIQISKGFTSPIYGFNQMGGAINMISSKPEKELEFSASARYLNPDETRGGMSIGTNQGNFYLQFDQTASFRSTFPLSKNYDERTSNTQTNAYLKSQTVKLKAGIVPNENHEYSLNYIYQTREKGGAGGNWYWPHWDKRTLYLLGNSYFTPDLSLNTRLYYDRYFNIINANWGSSNYDDDSYGAILTLGYDIMTNSNFKFGVNMKRDRHTENYNQASDIKELTTSIFAQYAQGLGNVRFVLAGNYDRADGLDLYVRTGNNIDTEKRKTPGVFGVQGVVYLDVSDGQSAHITVGKKNSMPSLATRYSSRFGSGVPNPNLKVESAINYEVGYDINFINTRFTLAGFYNDMTDMIMSQDMPDGTCTNNTGCWQNVNAPSGYTFGGEIGIEQGFFDDNALVIGANYTYTQKKAKGLGKDNASGTKITNYPNHMFNAKIAIKPIQKFEFIAQSTIESARWYDASAIAGITPAGYEYDGYTRNNNFFTLDLSANYELAKGFSVNAGVLNVTDRDNYLSNGNGMSNHLQGRRYFVGFDYKY